MGSDMIWNECSLNVSDTCGCAAWHAAPTPRTVMLVAMQARSVRRVLLALHIRWLRHARKARQLRQMRTKWARAPTFSCSATSPRRGEASPRGRQGRLGQSGCVSFCLRPPQRPLTAWAAPRSSYLSFYILLVSLVPSHPIFYILLVSLVRRRKYVIQSFSLFYK